MFGDQSMMKTCNSANLRIHGDMPQLRHIFSPRTEENYQHVSSDIKFHIRYIPDIPALYQVVQHCNIRIPIVKSHILVQSIKS